MDVLVNHKDGLSELEAFQPPSRVGDEMSETVRDVNMIRNPRLVLRANNGLLLLCRWS